MEINVWKAPSGVFLDFGPVQIKLTEDQYATLRQEMFLLPANDVFWQSCLTYDDIIDNECGEGALRDELDDAVARTCESLGVTG